jgi:diguanylate cyclase (GGDEF)-like protein
MEEVAILILDLLLPDGDGRSLIGTAREQKKYEDLTVLVVTGKGDPEVTAECLALGATAVFQKPLNPITLGTAVSSGLHREGQRRLAAGTDPLTQLSNRTAIRELWERWSFPEPSSIGLIGIDRFRALEDRYDHEIADRVIAAVGLSIRDALPRGFVGARWEESEFLVLCPGHGLDSAEEPLKMVLSDIREFEHQDASAETFRVTASGGVSEIQSGSAFDNAVEVAKALLENAMEAGGNTLANTTQKEEATTVLFAEDDLLSAAMLQHRLEKEGFHVLHFPDGAQALEGALSNAIDLAILDVKMPGMDGFELLERLRRVPAYFEIPIIMLTSMGREEDVARGYDLGADDYILKPFSPVEVLARIRRLLRR